MTNKAELLPESALVIPRDGLLSNSLRLVVLLTLLTLFTVYVLKTAGMQQSKLLILGFALGATLYWATFSFANGWRRSITERKGIWLRAQMVMLFVASLLILPAIAQGTLFGSSVQAFVRPIGISLLAGAFMFGVGMQIAGSCASGTLYHVGGGRLKMLIVVVCFATGALLATAHYTWWMEQANFAPVSWFDHGGLAGAMIANTLIALLFYGLAYHFEKTRHKTVEPLFTNLKNSSVGRSLLMGGLALAALNFMTVAFAGRPWSVANAFPLWGAKASQLLNIELDLEFWDYWSQDAMAASLDGGLFENVTSVMNIGIILGALAIALALRQYSVSWHISLREAIGAVLGGLMLGYGATIGFGCNIGAFFGGVVSGSLHGWIWFVMAFTGTVVGIYLRPLFALQVEKSSKRTQINVN